MKGINEKRRIIELVWGGEDVNAKEMHYHQLIHKTRTRLTKKGFPNDFIMTIPRYGLCLNKDFLHSMLVEQDCKVSLKNKPLVLI
ncbi:hypothetical protein [Serratia sp. ASV30]|uniref:hypothetical protein n=1 Tax=Serratia sp. ASV30 TaxID=2795127 RepID=UPI0018EC3EB7|nr:hypothetical protein [Serratia sp. ASV30]